MRTRIPLVLLLSLTSGLLKAQTVLYSPFIGSQPDTRFEVIGKTANYYWIQKSRKKFNNKFVEPWISDKELHFEVYDDRMNPVRTIPFSFSENAIKQYFIPGDEYLDQILFLKGEEKIVAVLKRFSPDGNSVSMADSTLAIFPARMKYSNFILIRSQDKNKLLLLGFETVADSLPKLHSYLFDKNWRLLNRADYANINISQPCVQYDFIDYPLEHYGNDAIKLANSGEWFMAVPSAMNHNFLLFHFGSANNDLTYKEIKLSSLTTVQEVIVSIDNAKQEALAGILSRIRYQTFKNVRISHYLIGEHRFDFDTSFRFNTLPSNKTRDENIFEEYFMTVPGKGFLLLKEYGRSFSSYIKQDEGKDDDPELTGVSMTEPGLINRNEYTRFGNLVGGRTAFDRGDLTMFFFPAARGDSCWSGIINKQQETELSSSYLSYVFLPREDKLFFLYNDLFKNSDQYGNTTVLDPKGNPMEDGVVYWKINNILVFQKARQISENELAIPYQKNYRSGFAIIRL